MGMLEQKVVVVTGGAQGIGLSAVERFAEEGARVAIWDFNPDKGAAAEAALKAKGHDVRFQQVNVVDMVSVGEQTGNLGDALARAAARFDKELEKRIDRLSALIQPAVVVVMATMVGLMAYLMITAIFQTISGLNG